MKDNLLRALQVLRVLDEQKNLSLTNIALVAVLGRLLAAPEVDIESLLTFVAAMFSYQVKRFAAGFTGSPAEDEVTELRKAVDSLKTKTVALELGQQRSR
jgi:hypothetical protein